MQSHTSCFETAGVCPRVSVANAARATLFSRIAHLVDGAIDRVHRQHGNPEQAIGVGPRYSANRPNRAGELVILDRLVV
jgi:hypothetical protein